MRCSGGDGRRTHTEKEGRGESERDIGGDRRGKGKQRLTGSRGGTSGSVTAPPVNDMANAASKGDGVRDRAACTAPSAFCMRASRLPMPSSRSSADSGSLIRPTDAQTAADGPDSGLQHLLSLSGRLQRPSRRHLLVKHPNQTI